MTECQKMMASIKTVAALHATLGTESDSVRMYDSGMYLSHRFYDGGEEFLLVE